MNQQSEHLSNAQIENYGDQTAGAEPDTDQRDEDQRVEVHLVDCAFCRGRLLDFHRTHLALLADPTLADQMLADPTLADAKRAAPKQLADPQVNTASTPDCPSEDDLRQLAAGLCSDAVAIKLTHHAATCNHCGPLLKTFTEDFSDDFSPEEQAVLADLQSSSASWQKQTARQMLAAAGANSAVASVADLSAAAPAADVSPSGATASATPDKRSFTTLGRKPFFWKWILVPATAAALAAITFPIYYAQRVTPEKVEVLLAQASTERRNMEMRIPYAKHSEFHQRRSGDASSLLRLPVPLRKAADGIATQLRAKPDDPEWLLLSARLDLLDWRYKSALATLEKIEDKTGNHQAEIEMARALALYQRAEFESDQPEAYGQAVEILAKVLQQTPDDPVALHNQAVACEKAHMYECAVADWNRLLPIERDPGWSKEAHDHLDHLQEKKISHQNPDLDRRSANSTAGTQ